MSVAIGLAPRSMPARLALRPGFHRRMLGWVQGTIHSQTRPHVRTWASSTTTEPVVDQPLACTWLTTTPEQLTPDDILSSFPISAPNPPLEYIPILLFTPAFAHWADTKSAFLEQWLNQFYHKASDRLSPIHAVAAIIDRLPYNHARGLSGEATESEGVSILLARAENILGKAVAPRQVRSVETEEPTLLFSFQKDAKDPQTTHQPVHEIGLRLANTIFLNGKENTLVGARWSHDLSLGRLRLEDSVDLSTCSVTVSPVSIGRSLELPLHPVGERRKVISSMGNILRQISKHADGTSNEPMPASSELEKELPRYIAEQGITDQRVSVWALIETSVESPYLKSSDSQSSLAKSIEMGAKLHRVMSGGGGWGKKQGLLSLDPEMSFGQPVNGSMQSLYKVLSTNTEGITDEVDSPLKQPTGIQDLSTLSQAAEPGDYVQFFVSVEEHQPHSDSRTWSPSGSPGRSLSCDFGVVSNADTLLSQTTRQKDLTTVPNFFGALSEKAITYLQPLAEPHSNVFESRTKIDVPGSRVALKLQ
ncbi:hypothetical protein BDV12DRAFT_165051 [Aspergillus spectabilis]